MKHKLSAVLLFILLLTGCSSQPEQKPVQETIARDTPATPLTVTFMKVGKADGMILQTDQHTVVLDCGEETDGKKMVARLQEYGVETIDYMILTHYDQDHIGGAPEVLANFPVEHILAAQQEEDSDAYQALCNAVSAVGLQMELPGTPMTFTLDDASFTLYPHQAADYQDGYDNNCSLVLKVTHHSQTLLFTGDAMEERLAELTDIGSCDLLKVPYHGREIRNLPEFLENVKPKYAVISTKEKELSSVTVEALREIGAEIYCTFSDGNVIAVSDGSSIRITTEGIAEHT